MVAVTLLTPELVATSETFVITSSGAVRIICTCIPLINALIFKQHHLIDSLFSYVHVCHICLYGESTDQFVGL